MCPCLVTGLDSIAEKCAGSLEIREYVSAILRDPTDEHCIGLLGLTM